MSDTSINNNAEMIDYELAWLSTLINKRIEEKMPNEIIDAEAIVPSIPLAVNETASHLRSFILHEKLNTLERILLAVALANLLRPELFRVLIEQEKLRIDDFGGKIDDTRTVYSPTLQTVITLYAGKFTSGVSHYYTELIESLMVKMGVVRFDQQHYIGINDVFRLGEDYMKYLVMDKELRADFDSSFPAKLIHSPFEWHQLVLPTVTIDSLNRIVDWITYGSAILEEQRQHNDSKINKGYPVLFHGPPGTGKTMAAGLIGKQVQKQVYRIDLSLITSKYVGETEKNLKMLFDRAENKDWILFFDEADALFGKRTTVKDAHDKFANQEMSYLLQRIEEFDGVVILATNYSTNIDNAMTRRFQSKIYFPFPEVKERIKIWEQAIPTGYAIEETVSCELIAEHYKLSGANVRNIMKQLSIVSKKKASTTFMAGDIQSCIEVELNKEGRTI